MASLIPQSFIDDLLDRVDIAELVDGRVKLKKTGKNYSACCPFHDEKTPSFTVSPDKQFYHCFGCGASGNAIGFLMEYDRVGFVEAVEQLAHRAGMHVPKQQKDPRQEERDRARASIYKLLEKADGFYQQQLRKHKTREQAVNYLKNRGLDGTIARDFGIGYAPPGWDNLLQALGESAEQRQLLIDSGMLVDRKGENGEKDKLYDRFRDRIQFPIRDIRGRVIGFGGRVLGDDKPKYLNSPETAVFHKGQELYGLYEARQFYRELPRLLVVEGYMDVVSLAQFGIRYSVATLGTACGEEHLNRAFRHTSEVVFCFDGDKAGRAAGLRALENSLPAMTDGRQVKFLFLPEGEDPDTLVRQVGPEKFENMIALSVPLEDFLFDAAATGIDSQSLEGRARISKLAAPMLDKLPKGIFRELMFDKLAARTGVNRTTLDDIIAQAAQSQSYAATPTEIKKPNQHTQQNIEKKTAKPLTTEDLAEVSTNYSHQDAAQYGPNHDGDSGQYNDYDYPPSDGNADHEYDYGGQYGHTDSQDTQQNYHSGPQHRPSGQGSYLMPPARKAISLLLSEPNLASECGVSAEFIDSWKDSDNADLKLLGQLLELLAQRPHYKLSQILSCWRGQQGESAMLELANIEAADLVRTTQRMSEARDNKPARTQYNRCTALIDTIDSLKKLGQQQQSQQSLHKLKQVDFNSLSSEERRQLVTEALKSKNKH